MPLNLPKLGSSFSASVSKYPLPNKEQVQDGEILVAFLTDALDTVCKQLPLVLICASVAGVAPRVGSSFLGPGLFGFGGLGAWGFRGLGFRV